MVGANVNLHSLRKPGGYGELILDGVMERENDTYTCCHCNRIVRVNTDASNVGEWCRMCGQLACQKKRCSPALNGCGPFEKKLEVYEARTAFQNRMDKSLIWTRTMNEVKLRN